MDSDLDNQETSPESSMAQTISLNNLHTILHANTATTNGESRRLLDCNIKMNGHKTQALVDTGAAVSIVSLRLCQKFGLPIDTTRTELLCGFNKSVMRTKGIAQIRIDIGDHQFLHGFHVIVFGSQKAIIGNDLLIAQDAIIYPKHSDTNSTWEHIPCFNVNPKPDYDRI